MRYLGKAKERIWIGDFIDRDGSPNAVLFIRRPLSETTVAIAAETIDAGMAVELIVGRDGNRYAKRATPEHA